MSLFENVQNWSVMHSFKNMTGLLLSSKVLSCVYFWHKGKKHRFCYVAVRGKGVVLRSVTEEEGGLEKGKIGVK